jgi:hypothetical protein
VSGNITEIVVSELEGDLTLSAWGVTGDVEVINPPALFPDGALLIPNVEGVLVTVNSLSSTTTHRPTAGSLITPGGSGNLS